MIICWEVLNCAKLCYSCFKWKWASAGFLYTTHKSSHPTVALQNDIKYPLSAEECQARKHSRRNVHLICVWPLFQNNSNLWQSVCKGYEALIISF